MMFGFIQAMLGQDGDFAGKKRFGAEQFGGSAIAAAHGGKMPQRKAAQPPLQRSQRKAAAAEKIVPGKGAESGAGGEGIAQDNGFDGNQRLRLLFDMDHVRLEVAQRRSHAHGIVQVRHVPAARPTVQRGDFLRAQPRMDFTSSPVKTFAPAIGHQQTKVQARIQPFHGDILFLVVGQQKGMPHHHQLHWPPSGNSLDPRACRVRPEIIPRKR